MLSPDKQEVDITNVNLRKEKHGTERKLAVDISVTLTTSNEILETLEKGLKSSFFRKAGKGSQMDAFTDRDALVEVKHPALGTIKIDGKYPGYEMELCGLLETDSKPPFFLPDVELKDFSFDAIEGGSVALHFKLGTGVEPEDLVDIGEYYTRSKVRLSLKPPAAQEAPPPSTGTPDTLDLQEGAGSEPEGDLAAEGKAELDRLTQVGAKTAKKAPAKAAKKAKSK